MILRPKCANPRNCCYNHADAIREVTPQMRAVFWRWLKVEHTHVCLLCMLNMSINLPDSEKDRHSVYLRSIDDDAREVIKQFMPPETPRPMPELTDE